MRRKFRMCTNTIRVLLLKKHKSDEKEPVLTTKFQRCSEFFAGGVAKVKDQVTAQTLTAQVPAVWFLQAGRSN